MNTAFKAYIADHNYASVRLTCIFVAVLMPLGFSLDYVTIDAHHRGLIREFLVYRLLASALALSVMGIHRLEVMRRHSYFLGAISLMAGASAIEVMVFRLDAVTTPYYAGLNLAALVAGLAFVWSGRQTLAVCLLIIGMWLVPALGEMWMMKDQPQFSLLKGPFFNNLYFLSLTGVIAVAANATRYTLAQREYEARMALAQATAELQVSLERIRELDRLKSQFFANISHELRTPLTLITAPIQDILNRAEQPEAEPLRGTLQLILRNALRLHQLIDGLLDLARLEAGRLRLRVNQVDPRALVQGVVAAFQPAADSMGLHLRLDVEEEGPPGEAQVLGDAEKLEVVLTNLIGNALKFTQRGGTIIVSLRNEAEAVVLAVADNGPGIPEADQPLIFERFHRVESPGRKQGGAGIGLALVKELVELHRGTVQVVSRPGEGARFTVRLPLGGQALQADPNEDFTPQELKAIARKEDITPASAALLHVNDSLDSRRHAALFPPGAGAAGAAGPAGAAGTAGAAGAAGPGGQADLPGAGDRPWAAGAPRAAGAGPAKGASFSRILVAEDNGDLRRFLFDLLSQHYQVDTAADGRIALEAVRKQPPDLLLADVMMPHLSGIELCHQIKGDPRTHALPVILLTARGGIEETLEGFAHGADDYLVKPFNPRELLMRVAVQLKLRRLAAQVANAARLAAVGTLAAGVAHEIKNPLNAIHTGAVALRRRSQAQGPGPAQNTGLQAEVLDMIEECVTRISEITTALTDHARPADGEGISYCDLRQGMESTLRLLRDRLREKNVEVVRDYRTTRQILGRPRQLNQVFLNLLDNALRASAAGGRIFVTLDDHGEGAVELSVRDQGGGIPREDQERIFDPFFTTRQPGEGTGLGLYLSRQIIDAHGGVLRVLSEVGRGAEFQVELPAKLGEAQGQGQGAAA